MPVYTYVCRKCGRSEEAVRAIDKRKYGPRCCYHRMIQDWVADHTRFVHKPAKWPIYSDALGVHPSQVKEENERIRRWGIKGVEAMNDGTGRVRIDNEKAKRQYAKRFGFIA